MQQLTIDNFALRGSSMVLRKAPAKYALVMFGQVKCPACKTAIQSLKALAQNERRAAICVVMDDARVFEMSKKSNTQITATPYFIVYVDGAPYVTCGVRERTPEYFAGIIGKVISETASQPKRTEVQFDNKPQTGRGKGNDLIYQTENVRMEIPSYMVPYNTPWASEYKKMSDDR